MKDIQTKFKEAQARITSVETEARAIESELNAIPGVKGRLPNRKYGTALNTAALAQNITVTALTTATVLTSLHILDYKMGSMSDEKKSVKQEPWQLRPYRCAQNASERPTNVLPRSVRSNSSVASTR